MTRSSDSSFSFLSPLPKRNAYIVGAEFQAWTSYIQGITQDWMIAASTETFTPLPSSSITIGTRRTAIIPNGNCQQDRILIVDDSHENVQLLEAYLTAPVMTSCPRTMAAGGLEKLSGEPAARPDHPRCDDARPQRLSGLRADQGRARITRRIPVMMLTALHGDRRQGQGIRGRRRRVPLQAGRQAGAAAAASSRCCARST